MSEPNPIIEPKRELKKYVPSTSLFKRHQEYIVNHYIKLNRNKDKLFHSSSATKGRI